MSTKVNQKGRLKKLKKRAFRPNDNTIDEKFKGQQQNRTCGITTQNDFLELQKLISSSSKSDSGSKENVDFPYGPSVLNVTANQKRRRRQNGDDDDDDSGNSDISEWQRCDGVHLRDIVMNFLFHKDGVSPGSVASHNKRQKRKNVDGACDDDDNEDNQWHHYKNWLQKQLNPVPGWARLHNPACMKNLAVIEFAIDISNASSDVSRRVMPSFRLMNKDDEGNGDNSNKLWKALLSRNGFKGRRALPLDTNLFQGKESMTNIKSVSNILLYLDPPKHVPHGQKNKRQKGEIGLEDVSSLGLLALTRQQMVKEEYPLVAPTGDDDDGTIAATPNNNTTQKEIKEQLEMTTGTTALLSTARDIVTKLTVDAIIGSSDSTFTNNVKGSFVSTSTLSSSKITAAPLAASPSPSSPRVFAIDCEMVETIEGPELARVTVLAWTGKEEEYEVIMDRLVKPYNNVLNYLTEFSGITAKLLENVTTRIEEIQVMILTIVGKDDLIVGHSLENDLRALRVVHDRVIDTSVLFRASNGRKYSLRHLAAVLLKRHIQNSSSTRPQSNGHCSEEDAATALTLALRRARHGSSFKIHEKPVKTNLFDYVTEANRRRKQCQSNKANNKKSTTEAINDGGIPDDRGPGQLVAIGPDEWILSHVTSPTSKNAASALSCPSITCESTTNAISTYLKSETTRRASFLWGHLAVDGSGTACVSKCCESIDNFVTHLLTTVPPTTLVLFVFQRDYKKAIKFSQQRRAAKDVRATLGWSDEQEVDWLTAVRASKACEAFWVGSAV